HGYIEPAKFQRRISVSTWKQKIKFIVNSICAPFGVEIIRTKGSFSDLNLYQEIKRPERPRYINIGAGSFYHPCWHNLDTPNEYYAKSQKGNLHVQYDLTSHQEMPFEDSTIRVAYTSHVIEHIRNEDVLYLFREVYRCLEPGGYFRITCPDIDLEYEAYRRGDESFWKWPNAYGEYNTTIEQKFLDHFATALTQKHPDKSIRKYDDQEVRTVFQHLSKEEALDYFIEKIPIDNQKNYPGDHINWFNSKKIRLMLEEAGFSDIYNSKYGQSFCPVLRNNNLFDNTCPELSLYIECRKS
ncbi:MAG: methyltransferase domain-containing protein, partial [Desulfuromonadales bacterium]|nr:methyltransferase domain-containing protein [Desulfuromonadales bacterium]